MISSSPQKSIFRRKNLFEKYFLLRLAAKSAAVVLRVRLLDVPKGTPAGPHLCVLGSTFLAHARYGTIFQTGSKFAVLIAVFLGRLATGVVLPDEKNNIEVYKNCNPAVVNITSITLRQDFFFEVYPQKGLGSGVVIKPDGYILTNNHVIGQAAEVEVTLSDKSQFPARVVGRDFDSDLAVIKIDPGARKLPSVDFGSWEGLAVGQKVLAIGNPFGFGGSLTVGIISSLGRDIRASAESPIIRDVIQTDAAINPGNSGGPLLDNAGKLIGLNSQIYTQSGGSEGIGFAISIKTLNTVVPQLIEFGRVLRPWLGLEGVGLPGALLKPMGIPSEFGVMLTRVHKNSPAGKAGLRVANKELVYGFRSIPAGGDLIFQIDSEPVATVRDIRDYIAGKKTGDMVTLHYYRGKDKKTASVKLTVPTSGAVKSL